MRILYHPKRILGFEPYVAPEGFDRKAQPVDIYDVFERYYKNHRTAKFIYSVDDSFTNAGRYINIGFDADELPVQNHGDSNQGSGSTYRYGYELAGVKYTVDLTGSTTLSANLTVGYYTEIAVTSTAGFPNPAITGRAYEKIAVRRSYGWQTFKYTSMDATHFYGDSQYIDTLVFTSPVSYVIPFQGTKRYVITSSETTTNIRCHVGHYAGITWLYCGKNIDSVSTSDSSALTSTVKWIHIHKLDNITTHPYCAHYGSSSLTGTPHISNTATEIWSLAYQGCIGLTGTLVIPSNIKTINYYAVQAGAFGNCRGLTGLVLNEGLEYIAPTAFSGCTGLDGTLTIPNTCTYIGASAFNNCNKLDTLDLGEGVQTIGNSAFQNCTQLSGTLVLPDSLTTIGALAFYGCTSFSGTLTIPANITSIGQGSFGDDNFTDIDVTANAGYEDVDDVLYEISTRTALHSVKSDTGTITFQTNTLIIGDYCCLRNQRTGTITVPDSVTRVGIYAFYDCDGFTALDIETTTSSLAMIDDYAFAYQSNLAGTITIPNSVTLIDTGAFRDCLKVTALSLGTGLITIGAAAFYNLPLVTSLTLPSNLVTIGNDAFGAWSAISENLVIPNSVETIGSATFRNNTARTGTLTLGTGLKTIGGQAFGNVPFTGTLTIPSAVTAIGEGAFYNNNFTVISSSATGFTVSDYVLYDETASGQIKAHTSARGYSGTLTFKTGTTSILYTCLYNHGNRTGAITIPYTVTAIGEQAFRSSTGFNGVVTIGDTTNGSGLTSIGYLAFYDVDNVTRYDLYRTPAPSCHASGSFGASPAKELHVKSGATGYDVTPATNAAPWTNTAIFSSITYDL